MYTMDALGSSVLIRLTEDLGRNLNNSAYLVEEIQRALRNEVQ